MISNGKGFGKGTASCSTYRSSSAFLGFLLALMLLMLYWHWETVLNKQREIVVEIGISRTLQMIRDAVSRTSNLGQTANKDSFAVADRGYWEGLGAVKQHAFDEQLAPVLLEFFKKEQASSILELGAGTGTYAELLKAAGLFISCYDGNPSTQELSGGRCGVVDLSRPIDFSVFDWTLSLEVGEHIPKEFEETFITNLSKSNKFGIILSWAVEGQGGTAHVNNRNNSYIREHFMMRGYTSDAEAEKKLRDAAKWAWFKNTIMVFRKQTKL